MTGLRAFHNDQSIKDKYLARVRAHQAADNLIRGTGWENGKGCAVGCTLENYDHSQYPIELGIPEWLARAEDQLFEGMTKEKSRTWPEEFLKAITTGAGLEKVKVPFICLILRRNLETLDKLEFDRAANPKVAEAVELTKAATIQMIDCHEKSLDTESAESAAWSAESARSARSARLARLAAYDYFADELLKLLKECK